MLNVVKTYTLSEMKSKKRIHILTSWKLDSLDIEVSDSNVSHGRYK